ncbi:MAG: hypothetical protein AAF429_04815 [Pseudomonadota bacterium]
MTLDRTFYKVTLLGLYISLLSGAIYVLQSFALALSIYRYDDDLVKFAIQALSAFGTLCLILGTVYWVPKLLRKLFPEVN